MDQGPCKRREEASGARHTPAARGRGGRHHQGSWDSRYARSAPGSQNPPGEVFSPLLALLSLSAGTSSTLGSLPAESCWGGAALLCRQSRSDREQGLYISPAKSVAGADVEPARRSGGLGFLRAPSACQPRLAKAQESGPDFGGLVSVCLDAVSILTGQCVAFRRPSIHRPSIHRPSIRVIFARARLVAPAAFPAVCQALC